MAQKDSDAWAEFPTPLSFMTKDTIDDDNKALVDHESNRWRLLGTVERWKLRAYVGGLLRDLKRGQFNKLLLDLNDSRLDLRRQQLFYRALGSDDPGRAKFRAEFITSARACRRQMRALQKLQPKYESYRHLSGWLAYEQSHRESLVREDKREKKIRSDMRREAKWLQQLILDVFRHTTGCHHIYSRDGHERTEVPKFERSVILPDAHYFYLAASNQTLLGWRWKLPYGVTVARLQEPDVIENLCAATKRQVQVKWSKTGQMMFRVSRLDSPDALPRLIMWRDAMPFYPKNRVEKFPYTVGVSESRKFRWFDLASDPHILIAGKSQSGKSNLVNGIIATLVSTHTPDELRLVLVDQKGGIEFTHWGDSPHLLWEVVKTLPEVQPCLLRLVHVMQKRMALLEGTKAKDITSYNRRVDAPYRLARVVVVIDELNTFVGLRGQTEDIHNALMLLVSQGRAVGLHVIAATQHPEVKVVPGRIKTNMSVRLSGAMPTVSASMIILDNAEAARLPNIPGRFVAAVGLDDFICQVPMILDADISGVVSATNLAYPDVDPNLNELGADMPKLIVWDERRVLWACIEWLQGHLSGRRLHDMLGIESPGERLLTKCAHTLIKQAESLGFVTSEDGREWRMVKRGKGYYLVARYDRYDDKAVSESSVAVSYPAPERGAA